MTEAESAARGALDSTAQGRPQHRVGGSRWFAVGPRDRPA